MSYELLILIHVCCFHDSAFDFDFIAVLMDGKSTTEKSGNSHFLCSEGNLLTNFIHITMEL